MQLTRQSGVHRLNIASSTEKRFNKLLKKSLRQASKKLFKVTRYNSFRREKNSRFVEGSLLCTEINFSVA